MSVYKCTCMLFCPIILILYFLRYVPIRTISVLLVLIIESNEKNLNPKNEIKAIVTSVIIIDTIALVVVILFKTKIINVQQVHNFNYKLRRPY